MKKDPFGFIQSLYSACFSNEETQTKPAYAWVDILSLRPTQIVVGMREVAEKKARMEKLGESRLESYLTRRPVPLTIGPGEKYYILDRHSSVLAAFQAGARKVYTEVIADFSHMSIDEFWSEMRKRNWIYLFDSVTDEARDPEEMPADVSWMVDDSYQSLAWKVRARGGYRRNSELRANMAWAGFFRARIREWEKSELGFSRAVEQALKLARSAEASSLPGFMGVTGTEISEGSKPGSRIGYGNEIARRNSGSVSLAGPR